MNQEIKILNLGLDSSILSQGSGLSQRAKEYGELVDRYVVVVPFGQNLEIDLSEKVKAYGVAGKNKIIVLANIFKLSQRIIEKEKINIITVQDPYYLGLLGYFLSKKLKTGLEIQVHGFEKFSGLRKFIAKVLLPQAQLIRVVSQRLKNKLINEFMVPADRIAVVPIYTDIKIQSGPIAKDNAKFIFFTASRLVPIKNISLQIKAFVNISKKHSQAELWIAGEGQERVRLEQEIKDLKLQEKVILLGWQNDLDKFYKQADCFLLTSDYEGWGIVIIQAAGYELPIIMTDVGCAGEVIKNQESGLIVPVGNQEELEKTMLKIIEDIELRRVLGQNARKAVLSLPNKQETLKMYRNNWEKIILHQE